MRPILFCLGAVTCDVVTTYTIVETLGGEELNPLVAVMIGWGWFYFLLVKYGVGYFLPLWYSVLTDSRRMMWVSGWLHLVIALVNSVSLVAHHFRHHFPS